MSAALQSALHVIYPPRCIVCGDQVGSDFGLCGPCWRQTPFIAGLCCALCGLPLPEGGDGGGGAARCDDCLYIARPWRAGRAALLYRDNGRKLILALKHGDRHDVVPPAARWMARAAQPLLCDDMLLAPVPLHWRRLLSRRYNQAALLARAVAKRVDQAYCPDLLSRPRATRPLGGMGRDARFSTLQQALVVPRHRRALIQGRVILLVDDVMTSGATLAAASEACLVAGAKTVSVLTLARAGKDM